MERAALAAAEDEKAGDRLRDGRARGEAKVLERGNSLDLAALREAMVIAITHEKRNGSGVWLTSVN